MHESNDKEFALRQYLESVHVLTEEIYTYLRS